MSQDQSVSPPTLSIVIASGAGGEFLFRCLESVEASAKRLDAEVIVIDRCGEERRRQIAERHASVKVLAYPGEERPSVPQLRAAGVDEARADIVAVIEEHCVAPPDWIETILAEFEAADAAIGGPILDDDFERLRDWVVYFSEYHNYLPPWEPGERYALNDAGIAYRRQRLVEHRECLGQSYWTIVLHPLLAQGGGLLRSVPKMGVRHTGPFDYGYYLRQRYLLSRVWGGTQRDRVSFATRMIHLAAAPIFPLFLLARIGRRVRSVPRFRRRFVAALPLLVPVVLAYTWGEWLGYLAGPGKALQEVE